MAFIKRSADGKKYCYMCGEWLDTSMYYKDGSRPDGLGHRCKQCATARNRTGNPTGRPPEGHERNEAGEKLCKTCSRWKAVSEFGPAKATCDKLETRCKSCSVDKVIAYRNSCRKAFFRTLSSRHKGNLVTGSQRRRDMLADSCVCTAVLEELWQEQGGKCAITGVEMTHVSGEGRVYTNVSIDRVDSTAGYTRDNIRLVCVIVNIMKHTMSDEELLEWCRLILKDKRVKE